MKLILATCLAVACAFDADTELAKYTTADAKYARWSELFPGAPGSVDALAANDAIIAQHNAGNNTFTLGHNQFSALTLDEFKAIYLSNPMHKHDGTMHEWHSIGDAAGSVDWVKKGAVTPVKNQGQCGSCWAFSTTGGLEGAYYVAKNKLVEFSEEQLVDCDTNGDQGCNGGLMDNAYAWIKKNKGLCKEGDYAYSAGTGKAGKCKKKCKEVKGSAPKKVTDVQASDKALMSALSGQPVSVAIEADQSTFQLYKSGVLTGNCGTQLDHGVLAVGYGTDGGEDYYKVKNSWGATWGEKGYVRLARGKKYKNKGQCGILTGPPSYPTL